MGANQNIAAFFDEMAKRWDADPAGYEIREKVIALAGFPSKCVIADVGCGRGVMLEHLLKAEPKKILAVDVSGEMIRYAKQAGLDARVVFLHEDFLEAKIDRVDGVMLYNAYPHFLDKAALCKKLAACLPAGGIAVIAHGRSRARINERHQGSKMEGLSVPLESAKKEAAKFSPMFLPEQMVDDDAFYFFKLRRR